jgi:hypothetical protein
MSSPQRRLLAALPRVSRLLLAVYLLVVITQMFPLGLLDTAWWLRWIGVATSNGVIPVLAILLGLWAERSDPRAMHRHRRLVAMAVAGFALLIPLQLAAAVLQAQQVSSAEQQRISLLQSRFDLISDTAGEAESREALLELAARLSGDATQQLRLPMDLQAARQQVMDQVALGRRQAMASMEKAIAARRLRAILDTVRVVGLALLLALAIAALR